VIFEPVPAEQRLLAAMGELLTSARALSEDPTDLKAVSQRSWALRLAERSLRELGPVERLAPEVRERLDSVAQLVTALDELARRQALGCRERLLHARAETPQRRGEAPLTLREWAA